jgi:hypothetical protein
MAVVLQYTATVAAQEAARPEIGPRPELLAYRITTPPVVDGKLDDPAWQQPPNETGEWLSYDPLKGDRLPHRTHVWAGYDDDYLYFAFKCDDPDPSGIIVTGVCEHSGRLSNRWIRLVSRQSTTCSSLTTDGPPVMDTCGRSPTGS